MKIKLNTYRILEYLIIALAIVFLFWRSRYGYSPYDESNLVLETIRLFSGDILYADIWSITQNGSIILLPFYALFKLFNSTNEGLILYFRFIYCLLWSLTCLYVYKTFRSRYKLSVVLFVFLLIFQPLDLYCLSYYAVSLSALLMICCMLYRINSETEKSYFNAVMFSLFWTILVISVPLMAIGYIIFVILIFYFDNKYKNNYFKIVKFYTITSLLICLLLFIIYVLLIICNRDISLVIEGINRMLNSHRQFRIASGISTLKDMINMYYLILIPTIISIPLLIILRNKYIKYLILGINVIVYFYASAHQPNIAIIFYDKNTQILNICCLGLTAYFVLDNKDKRLFNIFIPMTILYIVFLGLLSSDMRIIALCGCLALGGVVSILSITELLFDNYHKNLKYLVYAIICGVLLFEGISLFKTKLCRQYGETSFIHLTKKIEKGSAKGIYTTIDKEKRYTNDLNGINEIFSNPNYKGKNFVLLIQNPIIIIDSNSKYYGPATWIQQYTIEKYYNLIEDYCKLHNKYPDIVINGNESHPGFVDRMNYKTNEIDRFYVWSK